MIQEISIENFFSVADRQIISFRVPRNAPELPCFRFSRSTNTVRLPAVIGVYGPNASGKSTILRAIIATAWFAQHSFTLPPNSQIPPFIPYAHKDWWNRPTKIVVEFDSQLGEGASASLFRYEIHIANEIYRPGSKVIYEALSHAPKGKFRRLFERENQEYFFGSEFGISPSDSRVESIRTNASVLSTLVQLNHKLSNTLIQWLTGLQSNILGMDRAQSNLALALNYYFQRPDQLNELNKELSRLDLGIEEMKILPGNPGPIALFKHIGLDHEIYLAQESMGTRRFIEIFPLIQLVLDRGGIAVIDELDTDIHPLIIPEIFRWFYDTNRNPGSAQLLFTAHNPAILDELEKEQVFFTEKLTGNSTRIYGASEIAGLRRKPSLTKKYLSGELGAVPHIG